MNTTTTTTTLFMTAALSLASLAIASEAFKVYYNVPTFMCRKYGVTFPNLTEDYGILQNDKDTFRGNLISLLYDPGLYPALISNGSQTARRNGGVPQEGNLDVHLTAFRNRLDELVPDKDYDGLIIIDFEAWRPTFRQNFGVQLVYKNLSFAIETERHPYWSQDRVRKEASRRFEIAARKFMDDSLRLGKKRRPRAKFGYYGFPYCLNVRIANKATCPAAVQKENDEIQWLFDDSDVIMPSVYLTSTMEQVADIVRGRVKEAKRLTRRHPNPTVQVLPYYRYCYTDTGEFFSEAVLLKTLDAIVKEGGDGMILWGSSYDLSNKADCMKFETYMRKTLGPIIRTYTESHKSVVSL